MSRVIREARPTDMAEIMKVMDTAKKGGTRDVDNIVGGHLMRLSENMRQWGESYPSETVISADMEMHGGFVIEDDGKIIGYFSFLASPEPTYARIHD